MNKEILRLAIPNILSNLSIPLLSTVDVALMGHLSVIHLGAIGLATMIFNFFFWNFGFLKMGTTGLVAQAYGANDQLLIRQLLSKGCYLALFIAIFIVLLQIPIGQIANWALGVSTDHSSLVSIYFNIRIWSAPATLLTYCLFGWLFGMQDAVTPMIVTILINTINILASYYLVVVLQWDIYGVAYGTLIAEYIGLIILLIVIFKKYKMKLMAITDLGEWSEFFSVNKDLFIRTVALTTTFAIFYRQSALSGALILATNVILLQFLGWMSYIIDGFAYASQSLVGRFFGAGAIVDLRKSITVTFTWAIVLAMIISLIYGSATGYLGRLFTQDFEVVQLLITYKWWLYLLPLLAVASYIWDGVFIGLTRTKMMRDSMLISFISFILLFNLIRGSFANAIWISFAVFLTLRGILLTIYWYHLKKQIMDIKTTNQ